MPNREKIALGEYYHIYNRGSDKMLIFRNRNDLDRFFDSLTFFNSKKPIVSLREARNEENKKRNDRLVELVCYCLNPNHFHLLLKEISEGGISEFMKRLGGGYTWYFNNKYRRSGNLFQGTFKSIRIESNEQLLHLGAYINLNWKVHKISGLTAGKIRSSWEEYLGKSKENICAKEIILKQFKSVKDYKNFTESSLEKILKIREEINKEELFIGRHLF